MDKLSDKRLRDWTLWEVCNNCVIRTNCDGCPFDRLDDMGMNECALAQVPGCWMKAIVGGGQNDPV